MQRRFDILEIPGTGAHAAVCLARDRRDGRLVCLKVLRMAFDESSSEAKRVRDEARMLERLDHPNIVRLHEALELDGREVLVMEWVDGPPVARVVRRLGRLPVPVAASIARQVALAVAYAYDLPLEDGRPLRLVHRDLNLANVLLGLDGVVRILDYGMARAEFDGREAVTHVALLGTQGFTAPEGLVRIADNPALDVYSLGVCLFLMITGHLPVLSKQRLAHQAGMDEQLAWARKELVAQEVDPEPVEGLIRSMCAYLPKDRPSMGEVVVRLEALVGPDDPLPGFVREHVQPLQEARARVPPSIHEAWPELAFLEAGEASVDPDAADARVRRFLEGGRWAERAHELRAVLDASPGWTEAPLLAALGPFAAPWWQVFVRRPPVEGALALLEALADRPTPPVRALCRRLVMHRDARVSGLAARISNNGPDDRPEGV